MSSSMCFTYQSVGNLCRMLTTIMFEKEKTDREIAVFYKRFNNPDQSDESDELFEQFLEKLFPEGATIGEEHIKQLVDYVSHYMETEDLSKELFAEYDKSYYKYYIYFKIDKKVYPCQFAHHLGKMKEVLCDYFKGFSYEELNKDYLKNFIVENFEIKSNNTTIEAILSDLDFLLRAIIFENRFHKQKTCIMQVFVFLLYMS